VFAAGDLFSVKDETLQALVRHLSAFGDRRALGLRGTHGSRWWSYHRLSAEAYRFAGLLEARGVGGGDHVAIWGANGPEWAAAALGAMLRGAVVVPIDDGASTSRAGRVVELARPRVVVHGPHVDVGFLDVPSMLLCASDADVRGGPDLIVRVRPNDPAFLLFTSGSTHEPHGVVLTHRNLVCQVDAFGAWRRLTRLHAFRMLALSPLSHVQGLLMGLVVPLSLGLSVLYSESVDPVHVRRTIRQNRINILLAVPRVQRMLADALRSSPSARKGRTLAERAEAISLFPLRRHVLFTETRRQLGYSFSVLLIGGATLGPEDERFWYECGYALVQGYGLTETSALVSVHVNNPFGARLGSVGRALRHQEVRIDDDGEVLVRGPNVSPGGHGVARAAERDGYLHTGDLGRLDARGRLWLSGRKDDVIVTGEGQNVYPNDVEAGLRASPGVLDAVVGDPEARGQVHAVLLLCDGGTPEEAVASANASLEPYQRVHSWSVWPADDFPRTSLLKVRRAEVIGAARSGGAHGLPLDAQIPDLEAISAEGDRRRRLQLLARYLTGPGQDNGSEPNFHVEDFGLSSLDVVELLAMLEGAGSRPLPQLPIRPTTAIAELRRSVSNPPQGRVRPRLPTRQPRWAAGFPGRLLRLVSRPLLVESWARLVVNVSSVPPRSWPPGPCIFAVAPHRHWLDAFAVQAALPAGKRTITVTNRDFAEHFAPTEDVPRRARLAVGLAYHLLWPMVFEFAIVPNFGSTREGLQELGRAIDRGLSPISFPKGLAPPGQDNPRHEQGVVALATQTELPVVPVWIDGNDELRVLPRRRRPRVTVRFGDVIPVGPQTGPGEVVERVESAFEVLAGCAGRGR
jgi:long-chain acyl-CoA synthetase